MTGEQGSSEFPTSNQGNSTRLIPDLRFLNDTSVGRSGWNIGPKKSTVRVPGDFDLEEVIVDAVNTAFRQARRL